MVGPLEGRAKAAFCTECSWEETFKDSRGVPYVGKRLMIIPVGRPGESSLPGDAEGAMVSYDWPTDSPPWESMVSTWTYFRLSDGVEFVHHLQGGLAGIRLLKQQIDDMSGMTFKFVDSRSLVDILKSPAATPCPPPRWQ